MGILPPTQTNRVPPQPATMGDFTDQPKLDMLDGDTFGRMTGDASLRRIPWKLLLVGVALFWALVIAGVVIVWAAR